MADIRIDRLVISGSGLTPASSERLARLIGQRLGSAASQVDRGGRLESVSLNIGQANDTDVDKLAAQIVDELVRQMNRAL